MRKTEKTTFAVVSTSIFENFLWSMNEIILNLKKVEWVSAIAYSGELN